MIQALAEARLLHRQITAQAMAVRMPFARRVRLMPIRRRVVIMIATRIRRRAKPRASSPASAVVHIMPATSKHCMDEQRSSTTGWKKRSASLSYIAIGHASRRVHPGGRHLPYLKLSTNQDGRLHSKSPPSRHNRHFCRSIVFSGLCAVRSIEALSQIPHQKSVDFRPFLPCCL